MYTVISTDSEEFSKTAIQDGKEVSYTYMDEPALTQWFADSNGIAAKAKIDTIIDSLVGEYHIIEGLPTSPQNVLQAFSPKLLALYRDEHRRGPVDTAAVQKKAEQGASTKELIERHFVLWSIYDLINRGVPIDENGNDLVHYGYYNQEQERAVWSSEKANY